MIRLIFTGLFLLIFFILSLIMLPIEWLIGKFSPKARERSSYAIVQTAFKIILFICGTKVNCKGFENIPKDTAVLYVGNHRSFFDIVISYSMVPPLTGYIAKEEIKKVPILASWMKLMNCLFLNRTNPKEGIKTILSAIDMINSGKSVFIFPEGTRAKSDDDLKDFKEGSFKIAQKTGCPIIPVAFNNTSAIFEDHFPLLKKSYVSIEFGKPIYPDSLSGDDKKFIGRYTHQIIEKMIQNNKFQDN